MVKAAPLDGLLAERAHAESTGLPAPHALLERIADAAVAELERTRRDLAEALDDLEDIVNQVCHGPAELDSMALSAYADAMRRLASHQRLVITHEYGRRVIGHWPSAHSAST